MAKGLSSILRRAENARQASSFESAARRFENAVINLDDLLSRLITMHPQGEGAWFFAEVFRKDIKTCEGLNASRKFKEAWSLLKELQGELLGCLAEAAKRSTEEASTEEASSVETPHRVSNRQRKLAKKSVACVARNQVSVRGEAEVKLHRSKGRTVAKSCSPLRAALRAALAA